MDRYMRCAAALAILVAVDVSQGYATNYTWIGGGSVWTIPTNWNPLGIPGASDTVFITSGGTPLIVGDACQELLVGGSFAGGALLNVATSLQVGSGGEYVGYTGNGFFTQTAGTNSTTSSFLLGYSASGSYNLSGSGYLTAPTEYSGYSGSGAFTQSGGTNTATTVVYLGFNLGSAGAYNLSGSGYLVAPTETIGLSGSGAFTQNGGTNAATSDMFVGSGGSSIGSYNLNGSGSVLASNEHVGYSGSGGFTQSGGTNSVGGGLYVGENLSANGSYNLSGSGYLNSQFEYVGYSSSGAFVQSGGSNSVATFFILGDFVGSSGSYTLNGSGYLAAPTENVGLGGSGAFTQSGGTNSVADFINVSELLGSNGSYKLSGNGYLTAPGEFIGDGGSGSFTQSGGTNSATSFLEIGGDDVVNVFGIGSYTLSGSGYLVSPAEYVGESSIGTFTQTGGTNSVPNGGLGLFLGFARGASGSYALSGGYLTAPIEYIGYSGSGAFSQSGGTNATTGVIYLGSGSGPGLYNLGGGLLTGGTVSVGASSTFAQSGGTFGPGVLSNGGTLSYTGGSFNGQFVNNGTANFAASFFAAGGIVNNATLTVPAGIMVGTSGGTNTLDNEATMALSGGTLAGGQSAGNGGPIVNNGLIAGFGGLTSSVGITNNAQIVQSGGNLTISAGTAGMTNVNTISLQLGYQLRLSGSTLANLGAINLNSSTIAGSGLLNNVSGNVVGPGTISSPFLNSGGALVAPQGTIAITQAFVNSGVIQLSSITAGVSGGSIANSGSIQGDGTVSNAVNNTGTIESVDGTLTLAGALQNSASGLLSVDNGSKMIVTLGLAANNGTINLTGGVFDNNSFALTNSGQITGYGTLRTGGLTNRKTITLTGTTSTVNGPVTNASGGSISVAYNPAIFTGAVTNNGYVKTTNTTVTWAGGFTNNAAYLSDPAVNYFSSLVNNAGGLIQGGIGDSFIVTGPLLSNAGQIDLGGTSQMVVDSGAGLLAQSAGTLEIGAGALLSAGTVAINGGTLLADGPGGLIAANLVYGSTSASTYQGILAGAGNSLSVDNPLATLVLSGTGNSYAAGTFVSAGKLVVTNAGGIESGTDLSVGTDLVAFGAIVPAESPSQPPSPVPEPGTLALIVATGAFLLFGHGNHRHVQKRA